MTATISRAVKTSGTASPATRVTRLGALTNKLPDKLEDTKLKQDDPIGSGIVTVSALNVRSGAGASYGRIGGLKKGDAVQVFEEKEGWIRISYGAGYGWVNMQYTTYKGKDPGTTPSQPTDPGFTSFQAKVTADSLWVRQGPGTNYDTVTALSKDTVVTCVEESNGWYKIEYNGITGWMSGKYLEKVEGGSPTTPVQPPASSTFEVVVSTDGLNVRTGNSTSYESIGKLNTGDRVTVLEEKDGWYRINYNGRDAWISASYTYKPGESSSIGQAAANAAHTWMSKMNSEGWKYDQNRRSQSGYFDCSAFTHRCWESAGFGLGWRNSEGQAKYIFNSVGEITGTGNVQPGDLLFYHNNWNSGERWRGINHVAIAIGGGRRIDAGSAPVQNKSDLGSPVMIGRPGLMCK